jgi:phage head maturation protease
MVSHRRQQMLNAVVEDSEARRHSGLSVGFTLVRGEIVDSDSPRAHLVVWEARLREISVTSSPANPECRIIHKMRVSALTEFYDLQIRRLKCLMQMSRLLAEQRA